MATCDWSVRDHVMHALCPLVDILILLALDEYNCSRAPGFGRRKEEPSIIGKFGKTGGSFCYHCMMTFLRSEYHYFTMY